MTAPLRRPRGTETTQINLHVVPDVKRQFDEIAAAAGVPQWAVFEAAIRAAKPGPDGIPAGWDLPHPSSETLPGIEETRKSA